MSGGMAVVSGELVVRTDRGNEPFADLSTGERWRIALQVGAKAVGPGVLVCRQDGWEALDTENRQAVATMAREMGLTILTAIASTGELMVAMAEEEKAGK